MITPGLIQTLCVSILPNLFLDELLTLLGQHVDQVELRGHRPSEGVDIPNICLRKGAGRSWIIQSALAAANSGQQEAPSTLL